MSDTANISTATQTLDGFMESAWGSDLAGLDSVIGAIANGARQVQAQVQAAAIAGVLGATGETNVHGEMVQQLDSAGSDIFVESLRRSGSVAAVGSEEIEGVEVIGGDESRRYVVQMDPVDGSSNIDVAVTIGSIFGIWRRGAGEAVTESLLLRPGREQVAAAYVVYGSSTVMVVATPGDVNGFTLDGSGEFLLTHPGITIPDEVRVLQHERGQLRQAGRAHPGSGGEPPGQPLAEVRGLAGRGLSPEPAQGRHIPIPWGREEPRGEAAADVRGQSAGVRGRAGGRCGVLRVGADPWTSGHRRGTRGSP